jgi:hypothetical protein
MARSEVAKKAFESRKIAVVGTLGEDRERSAR